MEEKFTGSQEFQQLNILRTEKIKYKCTETIKNNGGGRIEES